MKRPALFSGIAIWTVAVFSAGWFSPRCAAPASTTAEGSAARASLRPVPLSLRATTVPAGSSNAAAGLPSPPPLTAARLDSLAALAVTSDAGAFALTAAVGSLGESEARSLLASLDGSGLGEETRRHVSILLRQQLVRLDPVSALAEWRARPVEERDGLVGDIFFHLGHRDRAAAVQALSGLEPAFRDQAAEALVQGAAADDQAAGLALAAQLGMSVDSPVVHGLAVAWARREPSGAAAAASALPDGWREAIMGSVMENWASADATAAAAWASAQPASVQSAAWPAMVENLSSRLGPDAAVRWAESLPSGSSRESALADSARRWATADPEAASAWAATLPPGFVRDAAACSLASGIQGGDLHGAAAWASAISDPVKRMNARREIVSSWVGQQTENVLSVIEGNSGQR